MVIFRITLAVCGLLSCASPYLPFTDVRVVDSDADIPQNCQHVGAVPLGRGDDKPDVPRDELQRQLNVSLLDSARRVAHSWDADTLVFSPLTEANATNPSFLNVSCGCEAYRCQPGHADEVDSVPLVALLADPEAFYGRMVNVVSWGAVEFELAALFQSSDDLRHISFTNAIELNAPESAFAELPLPYRGYLEVTGRFFPSGSYASYRGAIAVYQVQKRAAHRSNGG